MGETNEVNTETVFGWFFNGTGFQESRIKGPWEGPRSAVERLKAHGFTEAPVLSGGGKLGILVYRRPSGAREGPSIFPPRGGSQNLRYAILLRASGDSEDFLDMPIYTGSLPHLLRLLADYSPVVGLFA